MNWLAHLHLASLVACEPAASLLPDLMNVRTFDAFNAMQNRAITLHQAIDRFTDVHDTVRHSKGLITAPYVRFSGVLVDIFYDYCLSKNWYRYSEQTLHDFITQTHQQIEQAIPQQPPATQLIFQHLIAQNWLGSYQTHAGIELSLARISQRIRRPTDLAPAVEQLREFEVQLLEDFQVFYPELCAYVRAVG